MEQETCNICGKDKYNPFRSYDQKGNIVHGCVSAFHNDALTPCSNSSYWHNRKEAKAIRKALKKYGC